MSGWLQVANVSKFKDGGGLGISLEGTVDIEDGLEVHPHYYIRSVLAGGPVSLSGGLATKCANSHVIDRRSQELEPVQLGAGVKGGVEIQSMPHTDSSRIYTNRPRRCKVRFLERVQLCQKKCDT